jgi:hypothetical protein
MALTRLRAGLVGFALLVAAAESYRALVEDFNFDFSAESWDFCEGEFRETKVRHDRNAQRFSTVVAPNRPFSLD